MTTTTTTNPIPPQVGTGTPSAAFAPLSQEVLETLSFPVTSNLVPSPVELAAIADAWTTLGVPAAETTKHALALVNFCFDSGSSATTRFTGASPTPTIPLSALAGAVLELVPIRKFCRYFAQYIWNARLTANAPPASWEAWNFPENEKFAGFDFFDGVLNTASLKPPQGLVRKPTEAERVANATAKSLHLFEAATQRSNLASTATQFTRGRLTDTSPTIQFLPAPE
ncbi:hypothetical protein H0H10_23960 [Streptomyces sp. TRM S81-3]|uniref:Potexviruses and carlaviruses coat protein domain-containing protein n=1 Tax=Streptomyces griseicoloratus TaxID=2752516 RepID=A0A926L678_9ACTN|nr:hypothetical protein [Streptomyces griseicoloratus]